MGLVDWFVRVIKEILRFYSHCAVIAAVAERVSGKWAGSIGLVRTQLGGEHCVQAYPPPLPVQPNTDPRLLRPPSNTQ